MYCHAGAGARAAAGAGAGRGGAALTGVPHWGHASDASGMDVPHLKQNIGTAPRGEGIGDSQTTPIRLKYQCLTGLLGRQSNPNVVFVFLKNGLPMACLNVCRSPSLTREF